MFELPPLPYKYDALEPYIDAKTMEIHHDKHHSAYIQKLNMALEKYPDLGEKTIDELLGDLNKIPEDIRVAVRNHGGGHFNHTLFWELLTPDKKNREFKGKISKKIEKTFGGLDEFKKKFNEVAMARFGSGWAWLVVDKNGEIAILSTANQDTPLSVGLIPVLGVDVWEHSYYIKYQNRRNEYLENIWNVINWKKVDEIYEDAI